jgi:chorismate mutase
MTVKTINNLRKEIDGVDFQLLDLCAKRFDAVSQIKVLKQSSALPALDQQRFEALMKERLEYGKRLNVSAGFTKALFELIHQEALRLQSGLDNNERIL